MGTFFGSARGHRAVRQPLAGRPARPAGGGQRTAGYVEPLEGRRLFAASAVMVADITTDPSEAQYSYDIDGPAADLDGSLVFRAFREETGWELWRSDGTAAGTAPVPEIRPGPESSYIFEMVNVDGTLYFGADDGVNGHQLWRLDSPTGIPVMVKDVGAGTGAGPIGPVDLVNVNGTLLFFAGGGQEPGSPYTYNSLWRSDGTAAGTVKIKDVSGATIPNVRGGAVVGDTYYFAGTDFGSAEVELWKSDGTPEGTVMVKDIDTVPGSFSGSYPTQLTGADGTLFFVANDDVNGWELWKSDGTDAGTVRLTDFDPEMGPLSYGAIAAVGGTVFFDADDGVHGRELWKSDGTPGGTAMVRDIVPGPGGSGPWEPTVVGGEVFFGAEDPVYSYELWKTDGTEAGTVLVKDINPSGYSDVWQLTESGGRLYFVANDGEHGYELWRSNGTEAGTVLVGDVNPGPAPDLSSQAYPQVLTDAGGTLFFRANDGVHGHELWKVVETTPTVEDLTAQVSQLAADGALTQQAADVLLTALARVADSLAKGNIEAATGVLGALENKVEALEASDRLSTFDAQNLIDAVLELIDALAASA